MTNIIETISQELSARAAQVEAAVRLLDEGATVPFIARYRKEVTGGLDDTQLRHLEERLVYLRELGDRRVAVLKSIEEQGKLTADLQAAIESADTKQRLEDLYLPFKPKRRTKAQIAREAGLEPLADAILADPTLVPDVAAADYVSAEKGVASAADALEGARQILMERFAEDPELTGRLRDHLWENGILVSKVIDGKQEEGNKFSDYFDYREPIAKVPSHRALAFFRGRNQGVLSLDLMSGEGDDPDALCRGYIASHFGIASKGRAADDWLMETVRKTWRVKLLTRLDLELKGRVLEAAEEEAIRVFALNLKALLLAAPAGRLATMGLDPGLRTGVKVAVVDETGKVAATDTIYPHAPKNQWDGSIARRLQDPLAELVKIEPKAIGVGQYQHDVNQSRLARTLDAVVEDCVNAVGVDLNTASVPLLTQVSGLNRTLAENIVQFREANGAFVNRKKLMGVPRFGEKAFQQSAGFLRVPDGDEPLDGSSVHPEAYPVVRRIVDFTGKDVRSLIGDAATLRRLDPQRFTDEQFGLPTVKDILSELEKPGRDPRPEFKTAQFKEGVETLNDLKPDMILEGTVTNVTNFGAFVDIGVHQDGLVHISALADRFVKDPHEVVKSGDLVKVKVMEVDLARKRIALSMRMGDTAAEHQGSGAGGDRPRRGAGQAPQGRGSRPQGGGKRQGNEQAVAATKAPPASGLMAGALADAFAKAKKR